ncbi:unnamed protein product [Rotaria sp. Silwood1]|nr:unnamed protein product [Rotaria sp. Silwood1]CAF3670973.1 unnamed protein product [Rotaria sp. Silwood1]CAF3698959.1 unnamed protein product [Rotaria sp. Silwood1]CAF4652047.1 unnamed protein product [Rotaria sp. Silwood1]CAF4766285.1 unnamed protein product [Rotaria sp. Silwood1]
MVFEKSGFVQIWTLFSAKEKRNIMFYIIGIMLYKFGLEAFNGSIVTLATNRYDHDAMVSGISSNTFERVGLISGLNQAFQCIGSILVAPLTKRWPTRTVLSISIFVFALFSAILLIVDAATGGRVQPPDFVPTNNTVYMYYGRYNTNGIIPIYCITGIAYGMVELIRRVIPRDIVGDNGEKLQKMDALVHVFYEVAGVSGAFVTGLVLIPRLGNNYAFIVTPILFTMAAIIWLFISSFGSNMNTSDNEIMLTNKSNYFKSVLEGFVLFGKSFFIGAKIIFTHRKFIWLWTCYSLTLYAHRYIENGIAPQIAKRYLGHSEWSQIIVGGSNLGELLGALFIFIVGNYIKTPLPWSRLDALILLIVWYIPYYYPPTNDVKIAWIIAATYLPIGFASAADDIALNSFIQSSLSNLELQHKNISALGAVAAFLYSSYIIIYAILNPLLGKYLDSVHESTKTIRPAFMNTVAIQMTVIAILVFASTFIPKGAFSFNPKFIDNDNSTDTIDSEKNINDNDQVTKEKDISSDLISHF